MICGTDGKTYFNACHLQQSNCYKGNETQRENLNLIIYIIFLHSNINTCNDSHVHS